jgi:hypothetical protein
MLKHVLAVMVFLLVIGCSTRVEQDFEQDKIDSQARQRRIKIAIDDFIIENSK